MQPTSASTLDPGRTRPYLHWLPVVALPVLIYIALIVPVTLLNLERLNPDAICYIRLARHLVGGLPEHSVSSHWSPLLIGCIAPLVRAGTDGLHAGHWVIAVWGLLYLLALDAFLRIFIPGRNGVRLLIGSIMAVVTAGSAVHVFPDILLVTCLLAYFALAMHPRLLTSRAIAIACGAVAGIGFLAKAYALPFFVLHLPLTLLWSRKVVSTPPSARSSTFRCRVRSGSLDIGMSSYEPPSADEGVGTTPAHSRPRFFATLLLAFAGFALVAGPWIALLSAKRGEFTITRVGRHAQAIVGPDAKPLGQHPVAFFVPRPPAIYALEDPEALPYRFWSPFHSASEFKHQLFIVGRNMAKLALHISTYDVLRLSLIAPLLALGLLWYRRRERSAHWRQILWLLFTAALFCSGLVLTHLEGRYYAPVLIPFALLLSLFVVRALARSSFLALCLTIAIALSFTFTAATNAIRTLRNPATSDHRHIGQALLALDRHGPIASSHWFEGGYVAYHADRPFVGFPQGPDPKVCNNHLRAIHADTLLVWHDLPRSSTIHRAPLAALTAQLPSWRLAQTFNLSDGGRVDIYVSNP